MANTREKAPVTVTDTGINGDDLADSPETNAINMEDFALYTRLTLYAKVTQGTSTKVYVTATASNDGVTYYEIPQAASAVTDGNLVMDEMEMRWTIGGNRNLIVDLKDLNHKFIKVKFDDPDDGTGTVIVTGFKSEQ